ncbi:MAG TPA: selenocysteine-specific translation elongation factor [Gemmatimonadales bacterium]|jgi:selenocysteine-specific elongation factor|nr:selenocysteine-specific translation elongation factor [Gemmatimonadales bacterium]
MIIGTAGHIDHGKSALVTALTGLTMDRLAEERRRGITIDLNFAPLRFDGLPPAGIVDVPGHEDFVRTMVAGASGIDLVLLVVDAAQGPQPQTWEHLAIVEQLRIPRGLPVITKADLAEPDWIELVAEELGQRLAESPVAFEAPAVVSATTGQGIAELATRLRALVEQFRRDDPDDAFRMPIDRAFSIAGVGTVVTGTPWSGALRVGDAVTILPSGIAARVRSLEGYGAPVAEGRPAMRTAVGLAGVEREAVGRGHVLVAGSLPWRPTEALDLELELLPGAPALSRRSRVRLHLGTAEVIGRLYPRSELAAGAPGLARIALEAPVVARGGDRVVLRSYSPVRTIGGGRVLDPLPPRRAGWPGGIRSEDPAARATALITRRPAGVPALDLPLLLGLPAAAARSLVSKLASVVLAGDRYLAAAATETLRQAALAAVEEHHRRHSAERGLSLETLRRSLRTPEEVATAVLDALVKQGELKMSDGLVARPDFKPRLARSDAVLERVLEALERAGLEPPTVAELERELGLKGLLEVLRFAAQEGRVIGVERDRYFAPASLNQFVIVLRELGTLQPITPPKVRERLSISRKYLIPLLEWADRTGVTRRVGDARVLV